MRSCNAAQTDVALLGAGPFSLREKMRRGCGRRQAGRLCGPPCIGQRERVVVVDAWLPNLEAGRGRVQSVVAEKRVANGAGGVQAQSYLLLLKLEPLVRTQ